MKRIVSRYVLSTILFILVTHPIISQVNDAGLWENIYLEKKITTKWKIHLNQQNRVNQNISRFYYAYGDFGVTYKWNKHISTMCDYVLIERRLLNDSWSLRHQWYAAIILKQKMGLFTVSDRIMGQIQYSDFHTSKHGRIADHHLRNKTTLKYNNISRYTYYVAFEMYYKLDQYYKNDLSQGRQLDRLRYFIGTFYELNKKSELELYYLYENNFNMYNPPKNFVIGIGYAHYF